MNNKVFYEISLNKDEIIEILCALDKQKQIKEHFGLNNEAKKTEKIIEAVQKQKRAADLA